MSVFSIFSATVRRRGLFAPDDRLVVAVSGGSDSTALLHLIHRLRSGGPQGLVVAHVDHGVRPGSDGDRWFVEAMAAGLGLPFASCRLDAAARGRGDENRLRGQRLAFLEATARKHAASHVALGHTRDDQAETLILNLLRGAGSRGLGAMRPVRGGGGLAWVRPLLDLSRGELRDWLSAEGIGWREDATNRDPRHLRNRVRQRLLPLLDELRPGAVAALARAAALLRDDDDALKNLTPDLPAAPGELDAGRLVALHPALARRLLRQAAAAVATEPGWAPGFRQVEAVLERARSGCPGRIDLGRGLVAELETGILYLGRPRARPAPLPEVRLPVPGEVQHGCAGSDAIRLRATRLPRRPGGRAGANRVWLDESTLADGLIVRGRRPGDRFRPAGGAGSRTIADYLADRRVGRRDRDLVRLLCCGESIVWVVGMRPDARFVAPAGSILPVIEVEKLPGA